MGDSVIELQPFVLKMGLAKVGRQNSLKALRLSSNLGANYLPGVEVIGAGYNPFFEYASADSITVQLFDWRRAPSKPVSFRQQYVIPEVVDAQQNDTSQYTNITGASINTYQQNLAASVSASGGFLFFSGSLSTEYNSQSLRKSENEFSRIQQSIGLWSLRLPTVNNLRNYLRDDFRDYLDNLPKTPAAADEIFNRYGSHFLTGVIMGGRAVFASATNKLTVDRSYSIEVAAQAAYQGLTGQLKADARAKYSESIQSFFHSSESQGFVVGGDGDKAISAFAGKQEFDDWKNTVANSPDFVNFVSTIPMAEIWQLCKTKEQADYLKNHFLRVWAPAQSRARQLYADYIDSLVVITGGNSTIKPPAGYIKIPFDLNRDAGGDYIYLCYHKASYNSHGPNRNCIDSVKIILGKNAPAPAGYVKLPQDLNKGAGGDFVYLCYRSVPYDNVKAIKDMVVIGGDDADIPAPYGYQRINVDLNKGAGGDFVYLCTSTML